MVHTEAYLTLATALPAMPEVAQRLLRSFERDDISLADISSLISGDQVLAGKVLRLANSARYAPPRSIATLKDATAALGLRTLRDLTLSACMAGAFPTVPGFDRRQFWQGNLAVAAYAQPIARALAIDDEAAYFAGLVLRTGQLLMAAGNPVELASIDRLADEVDSRIDLEASRLQCTHPEVTAALARHWRFPADLCTAFEAVSEPLAARPFSRLGAALRLASVLADAGKFGVAPADALMRTQSALVEHLHVDLDWLLAHLPEHQLAISGAEELTH